MYIGWLWYADLQVQGQLEQCSLEKEDSELRARIDDLEALLDSSLDGHKKGLWGAWRELFGQVRSPGLRSWSSGARRAEQRA